MYVNVYLFSCATYLAACSLTTRCDKALAASHCLSRDQRPTTLDVCTYSHRAAFAFVHEPLATPLAAPATHHNLYNPFLILPVLLSFLVLVVFVLACNNKPNSPELGQSLPSSFFTVPFPCLLPPRPAANDAAATPLSSVNRPCVYKVSINVPLHPKPPAWLFPTYINTPSLSPASYTMSATAKHDNASTNAHPEDKGHPHNNKKDCAIEHLKAQISNASAAACGYLHAFVRKTQDVARACLVELQNPVVLVNLLLHSSVLCYLCNGYANHNVRFLKGKPNSAVLTTTAGALGLLTLDGLISKKYYSRFDKK